MKKIFLIILIFIVLTSFSGCWKQNKLIKENVQIVADAFTNNDMEILNKTIFGANKFEVDEKLSDIWGKANEPQEGVLNYIFEYVTVKVKKTTDSTIEFEIESPDMRKVFIDIDTSVANISEDELLEYFKSYAQNAETRHTTVSLDYILVDDEPIVNYQDEDFINAVTGGLLDAYKSLYKEMLKEYAEGVS